MIGIIFGSSMGNTEEAASFLAENLGLENELLNVANCDAAKLNGFDKLILGVSTWGTGDLQDDWDAFDFGGLKLSGEISLASTLLHLNFAVKQLLYLSAFSALYCASKLPSSSFMRSFSFFIASISRSLICTLPACASAIL